MREREGTIVDDTVGSDRIVDSRRSRSMDQELDLMRQCIHCLEPLLSVVGVDVAAIVRRPQRMVQTADERTREGRRRTETDTDGNLRGDGYCDVLWQASGDRGRIVLEGVVRGSWERYHGRLRQHRVEQEQEREHSDIISRRRGRGGCGGARIDDL